MPLLIGSDAKFEILQALKFTNEKELEQLLRANPDLLRDDTSVEGERNPPIKWVASQVNLEEAGFLDLLFVDGEGMPIAVEVKLSVNEEARRKVVAQAVDYLSALTELTVDELDDRIMIRARVISHLKALQKRFPSLGDMEILRLSNRDYRYRLIAPKLLWAAIVTEIALEQ